MLGRLFLVVSRPLGRRADCALGFQPSKAFTPCRHAKEGYFFLAFLAFFLGAAFFFAAFFLATVHPPKKVSARSISVTSWSHRFETGLTLNPRTELLLNVLRSVRHEFQHTPQDPKPRSGKDV
jgi:hypothetical protein